MTLPQYLALLDTLLRAAALEDAKAADGEAAMTRWAVVAVPRWREVSDQVGAAEAAQPTETAGWYRAWRAEQARSMRWPFPCDTPGQQVPSPQAAAVVEQFTLSPRGAAICARANKVKTARAAR